MMNSLSKDELTGILNETLRLLSHGVIAHETENSIDTAVATFTQEDGLAVPDNHVAFLQMAGVFVAHIYGHGLALPRVLTLERAQAKALYLLEQGYQGTYGNGFEGALRDARKHGKEGVRAVLVALAEIIKEVQRQRYVYWVLKTRIDRLPWYVKRDLTSLILEQWGAFLGEDLVRQPVEELMAGCAEIIYAYAASNDALRQRWRFRQRKTNPSDSR
jgi:RNA binding exosome subunit